MPRRGSGFEQQKCRYRNAKGSQLDLSGTARGCNLPFRLAQAASGHGFRAERFEQGERQQFLIHLAIGREQLLLLRRSEIGRAHV